MYIRTECPACGGKQATRLLRLPFTADLLAGVSGTPAMGRAMAVGDYSILECPNCKLCYQEVAPSPDDLDALYSSGASLAAPTRQAPPALTGVAHMAEDAMLIRLLFPDRAPVVLDYGMGQGTWARLAGAYGCEVWATDVAEEAAMIAARAGAQFVRHDSLPTGHFNFVNADQVFEHLAEPIHVIEKLARSLKAGGMLKITTPGERRRRLCAKIARAEAGGYRPDELLRELDSLYPLMHLNLFAARSLQALAGRAGLRPFRLPVALAYSVMTLFNCPRQWNRNLYNPLRRWRAAGTWQLFRKSADTSDPARAS